MGYGMNIFDYIEDGAVQGEQARWSARSPFRPRADFDLMLVPRTPDWSEDESSRAALERIEAEPWVEKIAVDDGEVLLRLTNELGRGDREAAGERRRRRRRRLRPRRGQTLRRLLLGRQHDQGAAHRPPAQPRRRPRDRRRPGAGRGPGRAPQPDLRRRPQHGRGDGRRRPERPRPAGLARGRREERPLRRRLLCRLRHRRPRRRGGRRRRRRRRCRGLGRTRVLDVQRQG